MFKNRNLSLKIQIKFSINFCHSTKEDVRGKVRNQSKGQKIEGESKSHFNALLVVRFNAFLSTNNLRKLLIKFQKPKLSNILIKNKAKTQDSKNG